MKPAWRILAWTGLLFSCAALLLAGWMALKGVPRDYPLKGVPPAALLFVAFFGWATGYIARRIGSPNPAARRQAIGRVVLAGLGIGLAFLVGEIGVRRLVSSQQGRNTIENLKKARHGGRGMGVRGTHPLVSIIRPSANPQLVYELETNLNLMFAHARVHTNSRGMRDSHEYAPDKPPGTIRIIGLGDSGMFGWDLQQDEDYMAVLEERLNRRGDGCRYEALNMAVPAYNTWQEVELLEMRGLEFKPDIVIVGWCDNDYLPPFCRPEKQNVRRLDVSFLYCILFDRERFADIALMQIHDGREVRADQMPEYLSGQAGDTGVSRALQRLRGLADSNGFHVLVFGPAKTGISNLCAQAGLLFYNTYDHIPTDRYPKTWLVHFMHPTAEGHGVLAEFLEQKLEENNWLGPRM